MRRRSNIIAVSVFLLATALVFLIPPRNRQRLQAGFVSVVSPFLKKGSEWDAQWKSYQSGVKKLGELEAENARLKTEAQKNRAENQALRDVEAENLRLQKALGYQTQSPFTLLPARVIGRPGTNWWSAVLLDKGSAEDVEVGMCVLTADGLVGKIVQTAEHVSTVLLITDENCKVPARVGDSKDIGRQGVVRVLVHGDRVSEIARPRMVLIYVDKNLPLSPGQEVFTSGASQIFPPGVLIGRVLDSKARDLDKEATMEPAVDLAGLSDVFIVAGMKGAQVQK
jgi:rod shape-determining protein MreC